MVAQSRDETMTATRWRHARRRIARDGRRDEDAKPAPPWRLISEREETWWLARAGAECEGDVAPRAEVGYRGRQMQDETAHRRDDVDAELEQPVSFAKTSAALLWVVIATGSRALCLFR